MTFGMDEFGLSVKRLDDAKAELEASFRAKFGQNVNLDPQSVNGVEIGIMAEQIADAWEALEEAYAAAYRDSASGVALDRIGALVGITRDPATKSVVVLSLIGTNGTPIPEGSQVSDGTDGATKWITLGDATIAGGIASVSASPAEYGPIVALSGTLTTIETPVSGWVAVTNALDADKGRTEETDASFRARIYQRRAAAGSSKLLGIVGAVAEVRVADVKVVTETQGFENLTIATDVDGRPAKSFEIIAAVPAGAANDNAIAQAIWDSKPAGIEAYGVGSSGTATDAEGATHTVPFSRPADVNIYVTAEIELVEDGEGEGYPLTGDDLVIAEILSYEDTVRTGRDVSPFGIARLIETPGIAKLTIKLGLSSNPTSTDVLEIGPRQRAALDSSRIEIVKV